MSLRRATNRLEADKLVVPKKMAILNKLSQRQEAGVQFPHPDCIACCALKTVRNTWLGSRTNTCSILAGVEAGCPCCELLMVVLEPHIPDPRGEQTEIACIDGDLFIAVRTKGVKLEVCGPPNPLSNPCWSHHTKDYIPPFEGCHGIEQAVNQINKWLESECVKQDQSVAESKHWMCRATLECQPLPTRVLEISSENDVRLHIGSSTETARYACLSYCWGGELPIRTTKTNLSEHQTFIQWDALPKTFQDAIKLVRRLGLRYIWIDSLCIVQDDPEDWRNEAGRMSSVYSQAFITIAAAKSPNSNGGLYSPEGSSQFYTFTNEKHRSSQIQVRQRPGDDLERSPLHSRGWVLQERLLSPRVVHFGRHELQWECMGVTRCECGDEHLSGGAVPGKVLSKQERMAPNVVDVRRRWMDIVSNYSQLNLTYERDALPALQGVAELMQHQRGDDYFAGLWRDTLAIDLVWHCSRSPQSTRRQPYRAPTWSWASCTGQIMWIPLISSKPEKFEPKVSILSVSTTPLGQSSLGEVIAGELRLEGSCLRAPLCHSKGRLGLKVRSRFQSIFSDIGDSQIVENSIALIMLVGSWEGFDYHLVLVPHSHQRDTFERIGIFSWAQREQCSQELWTNEVLTIV